MAMTITAIAAHRTLFNQNISEKFGKWQDHSIAYTCNARSCRVGFHKKKKKKWKCSCEAGLAISGIFVCLFPFALLDGHIHARAESVSNIVQRNETIFGLIRFGRIFFFFGRQSHQPITRVLSCYLSSVCADNLLISCNMFAAYFGLWTRHMRVRCASIESNANANSWFLSFTFDRVWVRVVQWNVSWIVKHTRIHIRVRGHNR